MTGQYSVALREMSNFAWVHSFDAILDTAADDFTLNRFVEVAATAAAKLYGLYPRKGTIAVGADADIAVWDPDKAVTIGHEMLHDNMDYTPYEGRRVTGWPILTLSRGRAVWRDGQVVATPGQGRFLPCGLPEAARPLGRPVHGFDPATGAVAADD